MINKLSEDLLLAVKMGKSTSEVTTNLSMLDLSFLKGELNDDESKKAFWINIYNAFYLILKVVKKLDKGVIYKTKEIVIAKQKFSLDDIEHGILRRYRSKYSLGYLPKLFVRSIIKDLAVDRVDYRIHFALNCGAKSCPPIAFYNFDHIDTQLEMATNSFVEGETDIDDDKRLVTTTSLFNWYKADFGGIDNVKAIISKVFDKDLSSFSISYKKYNWEEDLYNFANE